MNQYNGWDLYNHIPDGWKIDYSCGSPLAGYVFINDGKNVLHGGKRALLKVHGECLGVCQGDTKIVSYTDPEKRRPTIKTFDASTAKAVNELARKRFEQRILNDIMVDLMICDIEGWIKTEYIRELRKLIAGLIRNNRCIETAQLDLLQ
jgi:hypothetical protein